MSLAVLTHFDLHQFMATKCTASYFVSLVCGLSLQLQVGEMLAQSECLKPS